MYYTGHQHEFIFSIHTKLSIPKHKAISLIKSKREATRIPDVLKDSPLVLGVCFAPEIFLWL